ncbi:hypothetical protein ABPG72_012395 [Tetrahymena utriculariae]
MALFFRIEDILPQEIEDAKNFKGWLKKKSPNFLGGWQKRYFVIAANGEKSYSLAYFENEKDPKPKGHIDIAKIQDIHYDGDRIFSIIYPERNFDLKPKTSQLRAQWSRNLMIIKKWLQKKYPNMQIPLEPLTNSQRSSIVSPRKSWKTFSERSLSSICVQKDKVSNLDSNNSGSESKSPDSARIGSKSNLDLEIDNNYLIQKCGLIDHVNPESPKYQNRILCGFLHKRSKGKVKYFMKRWFILISAKPLSSEYFDEEILQETDLPPWMELDTLYQFKIESKENIGKPKKGLKMSQCIEVFDKDMSKSKEKGFTFSINMGDRLYHLMAETAVERIAWVSKLKTSIKTIKELNKGNLKIKKNIDGILKEYDKHTSFIERRKSLREKIDADILKFKSAALGKELTEDEKIQDIDIFLNFLQMLATEMLDVMNACLAKQPKREDLIKEYTDYLHEYICNLLREFWEQKFSTFDGVQLLKLSTWISKYQEDLKKFINDDRIEHGLNTLIRIHTNRSIEAAEGIIDGILEYERKNNLQEELDRVIKEKEILTSTTYVDLFKIINEGLDFSYAICSCQELVKQFGLYGSQLIQYYLEGVQNIIDEMDFSINQLICICNNTLNFNDSSNKYYNRLISIKGIKEEDIEKTYNKSLIAKSFINLSNNAYNKVENYILDELPTYFSKKSFLDIKLGDTLQQFVESRIKSIKIFHDRFQRKAWKQILDQLILYYFQCMILSCPKAKKEQIDDFVEKLEDDQKLLEEEFSAFLTDSSLKSSLKPFQEMIDFITEDSEIKIQKNCRNLRVCFGPAFTFKTVKTILELRKDLDKETRNDMIQFCQDTLQLYNKEHAQEVEEQEIDMRINVLGVEQQMYRDSMEIETADSIDGKLQKRKTISLSITMNDVKNKQQLKILFNQLNKFSNQKSDATQEQLNQDVIPRKDSYMSRRSTLDDQKPREFIEEGYLLKKSLNHKQFPFICLINLIFKNIFSFYEKRYFRIRNGVLFWYLSERAQEVQNKIELSVVEDIKEKEESCSFQLNLEDKKSGKKGKSYKLKAENIEEMILWVKTLRRELNKIHNYNIEEELKFEAQKTGQGKAPLFKDYDTIRRAQRVKQKLEEKKKKQEEKERQRKEELQRIQSSQNRESKNRISLVKQTPQLDFPISNKNNRALELSESPKFKSHGQIRMAPSCGCWTKFLSLLGVSKN